MAEDAAAPVSDLEQQEEQQQEAALEQAEEAGLKKRERGDDEDEQEPTAKRPNHNAEDEEDPPAADELPAATAEAAQQDAPVEAAADGGDCPDNAGGAAADPTAEGAAPAAAADEAAAGNPGPAGGNPGTGVGVPAGHSPDDREYTVHPDGTVSEVLHIAKTMIGKLIGKAGATIMGLQASSGASIQVDQATATRGGECRRVTIKGTAAQVESAKAQVEAVLAADAPGAAPASGETSTDVRCPQAVVGRIIGRAGETIKLLQAASGAYILVNQNFPDGEDRIVTVSGSNDSVERAANMIRDLIASDQNTVQSVIQKYGHGKTIKLQCPRSAVGRIIGRGGETVKMLQRKYNASVQINQSTDPMDITIIASPHEAEACQAEINHIIMHPDMPMGGGGGMGPGFRGGPGGGGMGPRPGYGGGGMPGPYGMGMPGMYGAMPYGGMMPPYGGYGMGMPPAAMPAYGGYAMGGGYDAAAYGGAGGYGGGAAVGAQQQYGGPAGGVGAGGAAASVWQAIPDDQGRTYYYNSQTGVSQWEKPAEMP